MNETRNYVRVGIAVVLALLLAAIGIRLLQGALFGGRAIRFDVIFDDVRGITEGAQVLMAGVQIGSVEDVGLTEQNKGRLRLRVERDKPIPRNSLFTIPPSLIGGTPIVKVDPTPGTVGTQISEGETVIGREAPGVETAFTKSEKLLESFQRTASAVEKIATDPRTQQNLTETLRNVRLASASLPVLAGTVQTQMNQMSAQTGRLLARLERAAAGGQMVVANAGALTGDLRASLAENRATLRSLIENVDATTSAIRGVTEHLNETLQQGKLQGNLIAATDNLRSITLRLDTVAGNVERLSSDPRLSSDIRETATNLRQSSESIRSLAARIEGIRLPGERRRPSDGGGGTPAPRNPRSLTEPGVITDVNFDTQAERLRLDTNFTLLRPQGRFYRVGIYDLSETNRLNAQVGQSRNSTQALRYGLFAGKIGAGLDLRAGPLDLRFDLYDPNRLTVNTRVRARLSDTTSALFGIDSLGNGNRAVVGVQIRR